MMNIPTLLQCPLVMNALVLPLTWKLFFSSINSFNIIIESTVFIKLKALSDLHGHVSHPSRVRESLKFSDVLWPITKSHSILWWKFVLLHISDQWCYRSACIWASGRGSTVEGSPYKLHSIKLFRACQIWKMVYYDFQHLYRLKLDIIMIHISTLLTDWCTIHNLLLQVHPNLYKYLFKSSTSSNTWGLYSLVNFQEWVQFNH